MIKLTEDSRMLGYELLSSFSNISHFVTTRNGGYGCGNYASFNCTGYTGDNPEDVRRNQLLLLSSLPQVKQLVIPRQVHDTRIYVIDSPEPVTDEVLEGIDALITNQQGFCLCISTADCIPILLYDARKQIVAAIHAGWRGTVNGITRKVIREMQRIYNTDATDIVACIGPGISLQSFEVGEEVYESFHDKNFPMDRISLWNAATGKHHIDLWEANRIQLEDCGVPVSNIQCAGICTYQEHETFFSARRLGIASGRILSGIMLNIN